MYLVKWKHIESDKWQNFEKPKVFETLEEAQNFIKEEIESDNGFYEYRIFKV